MTYIGNVVEVRFSELQQSHQQQDHALAAEMVSARTELANMDQGASVRQENICVWNLTRRPPSFWRRAPLAVLTPRSSYGILCPGYSIAHA